MDDQANEAVGPEMVDARDYMAEVAGSAEQVIERYNHCPICGSNLHFTHITDFSRNLTQETANCPECTIKVRKLMHRLQ